MSSSRRIALAAFVALTLAPAEADAQRLKNNEFSLDLFQGPILAPISIMGVAGAYSPVAEGISGFVSNAASPAVRDLSSYSYVDMDIAGSISIPLPLFQADDFDDSGSRDQNFSNFVYVTAGAILQIGPFGAGLDAELQRYTLTASDGANAAISVGKFHVLGAWRLLGDQLMLGGGARIVGLEIAASGADLTQAGAAPELGFLIRPDWQSFRIGGTFRAPVDGGPLLGAAPADAAGVQRAGGLILPDHVVLPYEVQFGIAVQVGPRPLNPKWIEPRDHEAGLRAHIEGRKAERQQQQAAELASIRDPAARAARKAELDVIEAQAEKTDEKDLAAGQKMLDSERRARTANWPREHVLFIADVLLTGPVDRGVSMQRFLGQNEPVTGRDDPELLLGPKFAPASIVGTSGATVSFSPRLGVETEPIPDLVHTRLGSYYEPTRYTDRDIGRQHFTFGADVKLFSTRWFGLIEHPVYYKLQGSGDFSARYQSLSAGLGVWH